MTSTNDGRARIRGGWRLVLASVVSLVSAVGISCGPSGQNNGESTSALLSGSTFETADGDLAVPNTSGASHDWNSPVEPISCGTLIPGGGTNCGLDLIKNGADDSLGQGAKEDNPAPTVVNGSIPPSKDDLSRFYVNKEKVGTKTFLYLAWERSNLLGSAHMDFEFNQSATPSANGITPERTEGDLLIDFDFGGSGVPVLAYHVWVTSGVPSVVCEANNTVPCWGKGVVLNDPNAPISFAEASVNSAPVTDTNPPNAPFTLAGNTKNGINSTFGEATIDLTGSGILAAGTCKHFGAAWLKSRSSGNSFTSELKDFIAPIPVDISNCGVIKILKQTVPPGATATFSFTHDVGTNSNPQVASPFTLSDGGEQDFFDVQEGTYHFTESPTAGFDFTNLTCSVTGTGGSTYDTASQPALTITVKADDTVTCTYTNTERVGAIKVSKTRKHAALGSGDFPQAGVSFTVNGVTQQTDSSGVACFDGLVWATGGTSYTVTETVPAGYFGEGGSSTTVSKQVTVDNNATCAALPYVGETVSFHNTPLTDLTVSVNSQVDGGTSSTVSCVNSADAAIANFPFTTGTNGDGSATATNLGLGTYTCTVVIDP